MKFGIPHCTASSGAAPRGIYSHPNPQCLSIVQTQRSSTLIIPAVTQTQQAPHARTCKTNRTHSTPTHAPFLRVDRCRRKNPDDRTFVYTSTIVCCGAAPSSIAQFDSCGVVDRVTTISHGPRYCIGSGSQRLSTR